MEEDNESGLQNKIIEMGELYSYEIKKAANTSAIDQVIS